MEGSSAILCTAQEHFKTIPNRLLFAIRKLELGIIRYRQHSDDVTAQFSFPYYCKDMKLSADLKMIRGSAKAVKRIYFTFKFMEGGGANIFKWYNFQRTGPQKDLKFSFLLY